jgi:hypothetical protein
MSITAVVENDTVKLPVHVPDGTTVEVTVLGQHSAKVREPGSSKGMIKMSDDFADPLPDDFWEHNKE